MEFAVLDEDMVSSLLLFVTELFPVDRKVLPGDRPFVSISFGEGAV